MDEKTLSSIVDSEFETAMGAPGGEISQDRADSYKYYLSKPFGNEIDGQSQVVTSDVSDVVDGIMPSLLRLFTTADNLVSFDPVGQEDEASAEQESDYVNHVFWKQQDPSTFEVLFFWFFDALVQKNGIVKAWWDEKEQVTQESYEGLSQDELFELLNDEELEPIERSERVDEMGQMVHDITFRRVCKYGRVRVENVPPEEYRISADARSLNPSCARMVGQEREATRSELLDMGYDKKTVDSLPAEGSGEVFRSSEAIARRDKSDETQDAVRDRSQDKILVRECYIRVDFDGDGRSELRQVVKAGNEILTNELVDRQPFHVLCPHPLPHKHFGMASAEKAMDIQLIGSTLIRQILDNLYHTNNPGHAVWDQAMGEDTLSDLMTTRIGRIARFARPVSEAYSPMTVPFTAKESFPLVEYYEKIKHNRTGIGSDSEGLSPEALKQVCYGRDGRYRQDEDRGRCQNLC